MSPNKRMFFTVIDGERPEQLSLIGFTPEERNALLGKIRESAQGKTDLPFSFAFKDGSGVCRQIQIGWADDEKDPKRLVGFR